MSQNRSEKSQEEKRDGLDEGRRYRIRAPKSDRSIVFRIAFGGRVRVSRFGSGISSRNFLARLLLASFDRIQAFAEPGFFRPMPVLIRIGICV
jgi:hypothetical protein